jgi:peptidoglycan hydrolase-like protein with peptidoglycan-binding domain
MEQALQQQTQTPTTGKGKKVVLIGLGVLATGTLGYFGWHWWKGRKEKAAEQEETPDLDLTPPSKNSFTPHVTAPTRNDDFPLKKNSKGARVKQVQEVLISKLGKDSLGKAGADGDFGSKTEAALVKAGYPTSIDENTFNVIVQGDSGSFDVNGIATELYNAATKKDFPNAIKSLQKLKSKEDYTSVSESFKNNYRVNGVHQTLVNGMLGSFTDEKQKQSIRLQFTRMGLNYDGKKWSLSGLETASIITKQATIVWEHPRKGIKVPANMVLGKEVTQRGQHTLFENNGKHFLVETKTINYL